VFVSGCGCNLKIGEELLEGGGEILGGFEGAVDDENGADSGMGSSYGDGSGSTSCSRNGEGNSSKGEEFLAILSPTVGIGVQADQSAIMDFDGVYSADLAGLNREFVHQRYDGLFMGDSNIESGEASSDKAWKSYGKTVGIHGKGDVGPIEVKAFKLRIMNERAEAMTYGPTQNSY
jgi:hypothetical protein